MRSEGKPEELHKLEVEIYAEMELGAEVVVEKLPSAVGCVTQGTSVHLTGLISLTADPSHSLQGGAA